MGRASFQPLRIGSLTLWPPLVLAPMAGHTDTVLRRLCKEQGAGLVVTELTSSYGLYFRNARSLKFLRWTEAERPIGAQIFGADPEVMAEAARLVSQVEPDLIDVNMGCWVPKVARTGAGAALLCDLKRAEAVMKAVVRAASVPVTIKTRTGWDGEVGSALELARVAEVVGVAAVTIHGRTAKQGFTGAADWRPIAEAAAALSIPVIGNGDVATPADAERMFRQTGCAAVMIGRAALGNPWIFRDVRHALHTGEVLPPPTPRERIEMVRRHARLVVAVEGDDPDRANAPLPGYARGQLGHYFYGLPGAAAARAALGQANVLGDVERLLDRLEAAIAAAPDWQWRPPLGRPLSGVGSG
ncbi:MAG: tRNA dihydrouridine synthase DusB [Armatimonadetes bacterium]|nr:tRNA dihydrouridine synthase DusB [Armatimonadota bacterium]